MQTPENTRYRPTDTLLADTLCRHFLGYCSAMVDQLCWSNIVQMCLLGYSLLSRSKILQPTLPPVTGPVHSCVISTPLGAHNPLTILALETYHTHCNLCPTKYSLWVKWSTWGCSALSKATASKQRCPSVERGQTRYFPENMHQAIIELQQQLQSCWGWSWPPEPPPPLDPLM